MKSKILTAGFALTVSMFLVTPPSSQAVQVQTDKQNHIKMAARPWNDRYRDISPQSEEETIPPAEESIEPPQDESLHDRKTSAR